MRYKTKDDIVQDVVTLLSQVPGTSVQTYSEDRIGLFVQKAFDALFSKAWWKRYMAWYESALDGTFGSPTADISAIKDYEDIRAVYKEDSDKPLPTLPDTDCNPFNLDDAQEARFIEENYEVTDKVFRVLPKKSTTNIKIWARKQPDAFIGTDTIYIDSVLLTDMAAYMYLEDDGTNPGATEKYKNSAEDRFQTIKENMSDDVVPLNKNQEEVPLEWTSGP